MNNKYKALIMKIISTTAVMIFTYPAAMLMSLLFREFWEIKGALFAFSFAFVGFLIAAVTNRRSKIFMYCSLIIPTAVVLVFFRDVQIASTSLKISTTEDIYYRIAFKIVIAAVSYIIGYSGYRTEYNEMLSEKRIAFGAILIIGIGSFFDLSSKGSFVLFYAVVFMLLSIIVLVQGNTDKLFMGSEKKFQDSSRNAWRFNLISIFSMFSIIILLFNMRNALKIFLLLKAAISSKIGRLGVEMNNSIMNLHKKQSNQKIALKVHKHPKTSYVGIALEIILLILAIIVLLYFIYKIFRFIKGILIAKRNKSLEKNIVMNDDFTDEVEEIDIKAHKNSIQKVKKEKRTLKKIPEISDPVLKVRYIYSIIVTKLIDMKIEIKKSYTPNEILKKSSTFKGIEEPLSDATKIYEQVRYGNHIPDEAAIDFMQSNCRKIASISKDN